MEREGMFNFDLWRYYCAMVCKAYRALKNELQAHEEAEKTTMDQINNRVTTIAV